MSSLLEAAFDRLLRRGRHASPAENGSANPADKRAEPRTPARGAALLEWYDETESRQSELVHLTDRSEEGAGFHSTRHLVVGTPVLLTATEGTSMKGIVQHSRRNVTGGFDNGIRLIAHERRRHDRMPLDQSAKLEVVGLKGADLRVRIKDASESGVQIEALAEVAVGSPVRIKHRGWERHGVVMHATPHYGAYRLGVQFIGEAAPSDDD